MIDAVFLHEDGYRFNQVYVSKSKFLTSIKRTHNAQFLNAVDLDAQIIIYPSNLPDYMARRYINPLKYT